MATVKINGLEFDAVVQTRPNDSAWDNRESKAITVASTYEEIKELFVDNTSWSVLVHQNTIDGNVEIIEKDMSEYSLAGSITDNRDGTITVKMGKHKETEILSIPVVVAPKNYNEAVKLRSVIENAVQFLDDNVALTAKALYPEWTELVDKAFVAEKAGYKFRYGDNLYKTMNDGVAFVSHYIPDNGTESLYARIDEVYAGTAIDPIPYDGNMALENGKHYVQNDVVYLCNRDTVNPVYNALADLVGLYVEVVHI